MSAYNYAKNYKKANLSNQRSDFLSDCLTPLFFRVSFLSGKQVLGLFETGKVTKYTKTICFVQNILLKIR